MKTLNQIEQEIHDTELLIESELKLKLIKNKVLKVLEKKVIELRFLKKYLEFNPSINSVTSQLIKSELSLKNINESYKYWTNPKPDAKSAKAVFESEMGVKKLKLQIKTLKYLLSYES